MSTQSKMKAIVFDGPRQVSLQQRPIPGIQNSHDIIVQVKATAICGSEMHVYRGHQPSQTGFIMGHEFSGVVAAVGTSVQSVVVGDKIVSPFTVSCGKCFYCTTGSSARCVECRLFGTPALDGGQAEYVRVPLADGTVFKAPGTVSDEALLLMADIFPTGYYGIKSAVRLANDVDIKDATVVVIGCGPVGLCAIVAAAHLKPRHLFAIDGVDDRLAQAQALGAEPINYLTRDEEMTKRIKDVTNGRGADIVVEVVGLSPALRTAFNLVRPFGTIVSIGVHNAEIPWTGNEAYGKNLKLQMGRCPVRSVFGEALELLAEKQHLFGFMFDNVFPLEDFKYAYELFDQAKAQKVIFKVN
ncbi:unnamed protein product [Clonostachys byssicola]|uniref:Enoyl reductase (ER) domain-containing protein n=1 Tax=Clonostachys byssicola TaxID=160290 RepID=A0A9N9TXU9_9HYPO|nr:unnamed protein product [Clonostachys byssicola]